MSVLLPGSYAFYADRYVLSVAIVVVIIKMLSLVYENGSPSAIRNMVKPS